MNSYHINYEYLINPIHISKNQSLQAVQLPSFPTTHSHLTHNTLYVACLAGIATLWGLLKIQSDKNWKMASWLSLIFKHSDQNSV